MTYLKKIFGAPAVDTGARTKDSDSGPPTESRGPTSVAPPRGVRNEILRLALRQSLARNGIPLSWIAAEALEVRGNGASGIHVRLLLRHWEPSLLPYTMAFQEDLEQRLLFIEPLAKNWLRGFSWKYQLPDGTEFLRLPPPGQWNGAAAAAVAELPEAAPSTASPATPAGKASREELERLFGPQAGAPERPRVPPTDFEVTRPMTW